MQLKKILIILLASLALCGCFKEHPGVCDLPNNLEVVLTYNEVLDKPLTDFIISVDVILFDAQRSYYTQKRLDISELSTSLSTKFSVPVGTYYAVAWGNILEHSHFSDFIPRVTRFEDSFVEILESVTSTGDPIYHAPHTITTRQGLDAITRNGDMALYQADVPSGKRVVKELDFVRAHRTLNVWIKGYNVAIENQKEYPEVTVTQRWSKYNFFLDPLLRRDYKQQSHIEIVNGVTFHEATFHHGMGQIDDSIKVILTHPSTEEQILTIPLKEFIIKNNIIDTEEIDILITFLSDLGVSISVPVWSETPVQPGI